MSDWRIAGRIRIGLGATLASLVLFALRIAGVIDWSWWLILAPVWIPAATILTAALALTPLLILRKFK